MHVTGAHPAAPSNRVGLVTGLVGTCLLVAACAAVSPALPPVADAATGLSLPGKVVWHDLITHTPDESRTFYQTLFGWDFERVGVSLGGRSDLAYWLIRHDGRLLGGMVDGRQFGDAAPEKLSQWLVVMSVADIDSATQNVRSSGGVVRRGPVDVQARGEVSVVEDVMGGGDRAVADPRRRPAR
jgi:predicted enzyme related to lactoylglutathione lyase